MVLGDFKSFQENVDYLLNSVDFNQPHSVNVFEVTIRVLGALLSAHELITDPDETYPDLYPGYDNGLLRKAVDLADRIVPCFDTLTGIPYPRIRLDGGTVNTSNRSDTTVASATSLLLEFGTLSELTGNETYSILARNAVDSVWSLRDNETGLFPSGIDSVTGHTVNDVSGFGAGMDSFAEYLLKGYVMFGHETEYSRFIQLISSYKKYARMGRRKCFSGEGTVPFYANVKQKTGNTANNWIDSLSAFLPGLFTLSGDIEESVCLHFLYFTIWRMYDALPERYNWRLMQPEVHFYPLRPELVESTYHLYRATKAPFYLHAGKELLDSLNNHMRTKCGYATLHSVLDRTLEDRMESFFLAETVKYLYLLFDEENALHKSNKWLFNTEGHLLKVHLSKPSSKSEADTCLPHKFNTLNSTQSVNLSCPGQCFQYSRRFDSLPLAPQYMRQTESAIGLRAL